MRTRLWILALGFAALVGTSVVQAQETCQSWYDPLSGDFVTVCFGGGGEDTPPTECVPGTHLGFIVLEESRPGVCTGIPIYIDNCSGEMLGYAAEQPGEFACNLSSQEHPCDSFEAGSGGISCGTEWLVSASVGFPETFLDLRPYPASLVRWPTAARCSALPPASGSGSVDYYSPSGGSASDPEPGDWRDLTLTLELVSAGPLFLSLPHIGELALPPVGDEAPPFLFEWELPSHPAAGGSALAGDVPGLAQLPEEVLPDDIPMFVGHARSPYRLFWSLSYEEYVQKRRDECEEGPNDEGVFECRTSSQMPADDGHWVVVRYYEWEGREQGGEIQPGMVENLAPHLAADLDQNGTPDAFWNYNLTVRRMDEADRVDNPQWGASWNWGGSVYWAVREAQGQVGSP